MVSMKDVEHWYDHLTSGAVALDDNNKAIG